MKRILKLITLLLFFAIGFSACEKYAEDTPPAIKKLIKKSNKAGEDISVREYKCSDKVIYYFLETKHVERCHYFYVYIYDKEGNLLCSDGGTRTLKDNNCIWEYGDCEETRVIW